MIAAGEIEPLIVVTPTFYCEDSSERKGWMNMDFLELAKNRYLERYFDPRPV